MGTVSNNLVVFDKNLGLVKDHCAVWMAQVGYLQPKIASKIVEAGWILPLNEQQNFQRKFGLPIQDRETLDIINRLIASDGIPMRDFNQFDILRISKLESYLLLVRFDNSRHLYKPLAPLFDEGAKFLIGLCKPKCN